MTPYFSTPTPLDLPLGPEVDDLLLHLRGLLAVRDLLIARGASPAEVAAHSREAERVRERLSELIGGRAADVRGRQSAANDASRSDSRSFTAGHSAATIE
ncbi:MAG TPA: hypothetical protein VKV34_01255 [Thermoleophilia bacterium]|nr:hypothetical protein [Thermoleophilia bacterium]